MNLNASNSTGTTAASSTERRPHSIRAIRAARFSAPALLFIALTMGAAYWSEVTRDADAAGHAVADSQQGSSPAPFEYFPHQYVNQAQEAEEPIQGF